MASGKFIVFEGGDKSGKSTQIELAKQYLISQGKDILLTREPGGSGSVIAEKIRSIILDKEHGAMDSRTELLLFLASRAQHVKEVVEPALSQNKIVLCDRFDGSTFAYQGAARQLDLAVIREMNQWAKYDLEPDLVIYLDITPEQADERRRESKQDRLDNEAKEFHLAVREGYLRQAKENKNWSVIKAVGSVENIAAEIKTAIDKIL
ncbi:MAG: dTMP kinase [Parcubacteria group bacterium]|nr:MAG: dTMP kinase [Parcubacteria group bacterium]